MKYIYIWGCILLTVYGQIIIKWRIAGKNISLPTLHDKLVFLAKLLVDPFILSGLFSAFAASLFWMMAMTKFEISYAYPFMSLAFVLVLILGVLLLGESFTIGKVLGVLFICIGILLTAKL